MFWVAMLRIIALLVLVASGAVAAGEASYDHYIQMYEGWSCTSPGTRDIVPVWHGLLNGAQIAAIAGASAGALAATIFAALAEILSGAAAAHRLRSSGIAPTFAAAPISSLSSTLRLWWIRIFVGWLWLVAALLAAFGSLVTIGLLQHQHPFLFLRGWECTSPEAAPWFGVLAERQIVLLAWSTGGVLAAIAFAALARAVSQVLKLGPGLPAPTPANAESPP